MAFLLMYVSRDTRRIDFRGLMGSQRTPRDLGRHNVEFGGEDNVRSVFF